MSFKQYVMCSVHYIADYNFQYYHSLIVDCKIN